jgi:hypothetical protein
MAVVIRGKSQCRICGRTIDVGDDIVTFPSGLFQPTEPAFEVNDAGVHQDCLMNRAYAAIALERLRRYVAQAKGDE